MLEPAANRRQLRAAAALLTLLVVAATLGAAAWPASPEQTLDPAEAALAPPGARFATLELADGRLLAARSIVREATGYRLRNRDGERFVAAGAAAPGAAVETRRFWLGSDRFGRDVAARLLHGARLSLWVAAASMALALGFGVPLGLAAGLARGAAARALLALIEAAQAFPRLFLIVALAALAPPRTATTVAILAATGWMPVARLVRAEARRLSSAEFVLAARGLGLPPWRVALVHVLPNALAPVVVEASLGMAGAIASEAALSFLGLGVPPPAASWGNLIADGRDLLRDAAWIALAPAGALALTVLACNLLAEGLRDRFDPRRTPLPS